MRIISVFLVCLLTASLGFAATEKLVKSLEIDLDLTVKKLEELTSEATNLKTPLEAVESLESFITILTQFRAKILNLDQAEIEGLDTRLILTRLPDLIKKAEAAGEAYGRALGVLPSEILNSDDFRKSLQILFALHPKPRDQDQY